MGTLSSELGAHLDELTARPRIYADANVPARLVAFMRERLGWDVLFVLEEADLRRARDGDHYRLARQLHRTLVTLDRDYVDDRRFPPEQGAGVVVLSAPDERGLAVLLRRLDAVVFRARGAREGAGPGPLLPLAGRKLEVYPGWPGEGSRGERGARRRSR
jgi:hypothetical protein